MLQTYKYNYLLILTLFAILFLFGCSDKKSFDSATNNVDKIKERGKLVLLTNAEFYPFEYIGKGGRIEGLDIDISKEIANDLGVKLEVVDMDFNFLVDSIKSNKGDICTAGMTKTKERELQVLFSDTCVVSSQYVITTSDNNISFDDLKNQVIAVQESTKGDFYTTDELKAKKILRFKSATDTGIALATGKCSAVVIDKYPAISIVQNSHGQFKLLPYSLATEEFAVIMKNDKYDLLQAVNHTISRLMQNGKIEEFMSKY